MAACRRQGESEGWRRMMPAGPRIDPSLLNVVPVDRINGSKQQWRQLSV
jgi:hypothetical protein